MSDDIEAGPAAPAPRDSSELGGRVKRGLTLSLSISWIERAWIFGLGVLIARGLTENDYAAFGAALAFVGVLITADDLGMLAGIVNHDEDIRPLAPTAMTLSMCSGFVLFASYMIAAPWVAGLFGLSSETMVFRIMGLALLTDSLAIVPNAALLRDIRQKRRAAVSVVRLTVRTAITVAVLLTVDGTAGIAWAFVAGEVAGCVLTWIVSPVRPLPRFDRAIARSLLSIGLPVATGALFATGTFNVDNMIVGSTLGATDLAYYLIAFNAASWMVNIVGTGLTQVAGPAFAEYRRRKTEIGGIVSRSMVWVMEAGLPASALLVALADPVVRFLYGDRYAPAVVVAQIIAVLGMARLIVNLGRDALVAAQRERRYMAIQVIWFVLVVIAVAIGAETAGLAGAAWGHVIAALIVTVILFAVMHRDMGIHLRYLKSTIRPAVGAVATGFAAWGTARLLAEAGVPSVGQLVVGGLVGSLLYLFVGLDSERRRSTLGPLRRRLPNVRRHPTTIEELALEEPISWRA